MTWDTLTKAKNIDKKLDEFIDVRTLLESTGGHRAVMTLSYETGGPMVEVNLNEEDIKKLNEFIEERIADLKQRFEEL